MRVEARVISNITKFALFSRRVILEPDPETNEWAIWCPELSGCTSAGLTQEEALNNIQEAIELYLQPNSIELPPRAVIREVNIG
jgi:predicted RNase H-like HicB family nuclease